MHNIIAAHKRVERTLWCLTKIAEQAQEGIAVIELNGTIRFVNSKWATMHGYNTLHELIGKQISVFHTKEQMKTDVIPFIEETKRRGQLTGPIEHVRKDGKPFLTDMKMILARDEHGRAIGLICFVLDITERKRAENEWQQCRNQLKNRVEQQTTELSAANEQLQQEISKRKQSEEILTAANEKLQQQIAEREQAEQQWQERRSQLEQSVEQQTTELSAANEQLQQEISKRKQSEEILTAANEKLQQQIAEREQAEQQWQERRSQLEQSVEQQTTELSAANEQLQQEISKRKQSEAELTAANKKLQQGTNEREQLEEVLLEEIIQAEGSKEGIGPFNPQELKALSELAKRLT